MRQESTPCKESVCEPGMTLTELLQLMFEEGSKDHYLQEHLEAIMPDIDHELDKAGAIINGNNEGEFCY